MTVYNDDQEPIREISTATAYLIPTFPNQTALELALDFWNCSGPPPGKWSHSHKHTPNARHETRENRHTTTTPLEKFHLPGLI